MKTHPVGKRLDRQKGVETKRYVVEMANDFEKKFPDKAEQIVKIRNAYIAQFIDEVEAVKAMMQEAEK